MQEEKEVIEQVSTHCKHPECIYRSSISGGNIPVCLYAMLAGEARGCKISECDKYKDGRKIRPRMKEKYIIYWETEVYDEDADIVW